MKDLTRIGIIICDRYRDCAGGKCFRSMKNREGAFSIYGKDHDLELVGYTTCRGCPGGNIEHTPEEMIKNSVDVIHLATGMVVGYPPCPYITHFRDFIREKWGVKVVVGTHPIPENFYKTHNNLKTWESPEWEEILKPVLATEEIRLAYD
ncbi:MAG: CGGC domain-containing protein [Bacteroidales bacterium]|nr:CGGC domain-containing protein [Bacteroidales bacterium]